MLHVVDKTVPAKAPKRLSPEELRAVEEARLENWINEQVALSKTEPVTECVTLSPSLAAVLMRRNAENRNISEINVDRIKRDIESGRWEFNGEPVIVSEDGMLNDGQHRCRAVLETGRSIRMVIVFGPKRESRLTLDQGVARTVSHYLSMHNFHDPAALASAANYLWQYKHHKCLARGGRQRPTKTEAREVAEHYKGLPQSLSFVSRPGVGAVCNRAMLAFCHYAFTEAGGNVEADTFMDKLIKGSGLNDGDPILYCRNRLIETKSKADIQERAELIFKTWNAWRLGERVERITVAGKKLPKLER